MAVKQLAKVDRMDATTTGVTSIYSTTCFFYESDTATGNAEKRQVPANIPTREFRYVACDFKREAVGVYQRTSTVPGSHRSVCLCMRNGLTLRAKECTAEYSFVIQDQRSPIQSVNTVGRAETASDG